MTDFERLKDFECLHQGSWVPIPMRTPLLEEILFVDMWHMCHLSTKNKKNIRKTHWVNRQRHLVFVTGGLMNLIYYTYLLISDARGPLAGCTIWCIER
jgi:hypothetical protein